jgi:TPR repeat
MAEYFGTQDAAESFMREWFAKDGNLPVHFAKILNHDDEKWIVNYSARQNPWASPYIKVLEDHSHRIAEIVRRPKISDTTIGSSKCDGGRESGRATAPSPNSPKPGQTGKDESMKCPTLGIRFDIGKVGSGYYVLDCWKIFWEAIPPEKIKNSRLSGGHTRATLSGQEKVYCIAVDNSDESILVAAKNSLLACATFQRVASTPSFADEAQVATELLVEAGLVDGKGAISGESPVAKPALDEVRAGKLSRPESLVEAPKPPNQPKLAVPSTAPVSKGRLDNRQVKVVLALGVFVFVVFASVLRNPHTSKPDHSTVQEIPAGGGSQSPAPPPQLSKELSTKIQAGITEGDFLKSRGEYDGAISAYRRALNLDPSNGQLLERIRQTERAQKAEKTISSQ